MTITMFKEFSCSCEKCQFMCHTPCCGTPEEIERIIEAGYGDRLCLDDWEGEAPDIHPALKGYESERAPWDVCSPSGCTFWKNGLCELHDKGLKPLGGRAAYHTKEQDYETVAEYIGKSWDTDKGRDLIDKWSKRFIIEDFNAR